MSTAEDTIKAKLIPTKPKSLTGNQILDFLSSVRFGVTLLIILVVLSMIGMLIIQQNVQGFDAYYASLTPAEKTVYGTLGFFDIYHSFYFNLLLLVLSLNIILASMDRFPMTWTYISEPKLWATRDWLLSQPQNATVQVRGSNETEIENRITEAFARAGFKAQANDNEQISYTVDEHGRKDFNAVTRSANRIVFGQSGRWNRIGAYIVHVFLLTLFLGHFVANQTGFDADVRMIPGDRTEQIQLIQYDLDKKEKFNVQLPFAITCTDIQQTLIDPRGSIDVINTMDWRTRIRVEDPEYGVTDADVSLNSPFSYRGYRFFQAQTVPVGNARNIKLELTPLDGTEKSVVEIPRLGSILLPDGTDVQYDQFLPDFTFNSEGKPDTRTGEYNNPVAVLNVTPPGGQRTRVFAFAGNVSDKMPVGAPKAGYKWRLAEYEKSPFAHILSIKYDPFNAAFIAWYIGGFGLIGALMFVFFFSHRRVWALIGEGNQGMFESTLGGNANRNHFGFADRFSAIITELDDMGNIRDSESPVE